MPSDSLIAAGSAPALLPQQVCFVVDDVPAAVQFCEDRFGWGPFYQFKAPVAEARYKEWTGEKLTEVALGMAGSVQVEFLHIHQGRDTTADYQAKYGTGFQHLGIHCQSRDDALAHLESLGARVNELNEYPGINFAFVDVPTGPGMFEILQPTAEMTSNEGLASSRDSGSSDTLFNVDRATIVTRDINQALVFYAGAFGWEDAAATQSTLRYNDHQTTVRRYIGTAGELQLEFIQPDENGDDPYSAHLRRGDHGLVHAGGALSGELPGDEAIRGQWLETGEHFALYDWAGGARSLQIRHAN
jgi:catechol 2,3-dioxygenase-like lactoylglutathione lyase family enzyme